MRVFYAFCRVVDDLADDPGVPEAQRKRALGRWREVLLGAAPVEPLEHEFTELQSRRALPVDHLLEIIDGVEMDLDEVEFATWQDLRLYCHRVAGAVGLVSLSIFGSHADGSRAYAEALGQALQFTNILRDVGEDAEKGRLYLPREEWESAGLTREELLNWQGPPDDRLRAVLVTLASKAEGAFVEADRLLLPGEKGLLRASILMGRLYRDILRRIVAGGYRVHEQRYRPGKLTTLGAFAKAWLA